MWAIGIVVCMGLMLAGHAVMSSGHGSHSRDGAAGRAQTTEDARSGAPGDATAGNAPEAAPEHRR